MNETLETIVERISYADDELNKGLSKIKRPIEKWVLPTVVGGVISLESFNLAKEVNREILQNAYSIADKFGELSYNIANYSLPLLTLAAGVGFVAVPAALALNRYYRQRQRSIFLGLDDKPLNILTENKIMNNPFVMPSLVGGSAWHLAYSGFDNSSLASLAQSILFAGVGFVAQKDLYKYFKDNVPEDIMNENRISSKAPLAYLACAAFIISASNGIAEGTNKDEKISDDTMSTIDYYSTALNVNKNFTKAIIGVESEFSHYAQGGGVLISNREAYGLGQLRRIAVDELNRRIDIGMLDGINKFEWDKVVNDPRENIRATVSTLTTLRGLCDRIDQTDPESCMEIVAASYIAGEPRIKIALEKAGSNNLWDAIPYLNPLVRKDVVPYVERVMAYHWILNNGIVWPTDNTQINSGFGAPRTSHLHRGIDIAPNVDGVEGDNIYAMGDGVVVRVDNAKVEGTYVKIQHGDPARFYSLYMHGQENSVQVEVGQHVRVGQEIMKIGTTGRADGPHLHFAIKTERTINGESQVRYINPMMFYNTAVRSNSLITNL